MKFMTHEEVRATQRDFLILAAFVLIPLTICGIAGWWWEPPMGEQGLEMQKEIRQCGKLSGLLLVVCVLACLGFERLKMPKSR
jgi:hypothetical protein